MPTSCSSALIWPVHSRSEHEHHRLTKALAHPPFGDLSAKSRRGDRAVDLAFGVDARERKCVLWEYVGMQRQPLEREALHIRDGGPSQRHLTNKKTPFSASYYTHQYCAYLLAITPPWRVRCLLPA